MCVNKKHKSSVFSTLFSDPDVLRELYSAIEGVDIPPDAIVDINTLTDVLYMKQINDISFTIDDRIVILVEHQSTICRNVPIRLLMYLGRVYEKILDRDKLYQKKLIKIPTPEFIVLYNGKDAYPDRQELKLSDAFKNISGLKSEESGFIPMELIVNVYNINHGRNKHIQEKCETLDNYSFFINKIREYSKLPLEEAVKAAIKYCIKHGILSQFLKDNASEVINMLTDDISIEEIVAIRCEEVLEDRNIEIAKNALAEGLTPEFVQKITGLDIQTIKSLQGS